MHKVGRGVGVKFDIRAVTPIFFLKGIMIVREIKAKIQDFQCQIF